MFEYDINYPSNHIEIIEITKYFIRKGYECIILPGSPEEFKKNGYKSVNIQNIDKSLLDSCEIFLINKL